MQPVFRRHLQSWRVLNADQLLACDHDIVQSAVRPTNDKGGENSISAGSLQVHASGSWNLEREKTRTMTLIIIIILIVLLGGGGGYYGYGRYGYGGGAGIGLGTILLILLIAYLLGLFR